MVYLRLQLYWQISVSMIKTLKLSSHTLSRSSNELVQWLWIRIAKWFMSSHNLSCILLKKKICWQAFNKEEEIRDPQTILDCRPLKLFSEEIDFIRKQFPDFWQVQFLRGWEMLSAVKACKLLSWKSRVEIGLFYFDWVFSIAFQFSVSYE